MKINDGVRYEIAEVFGVPRVAFKVRRFANGTAYDVCLTATREDAGLIARALRLAEDGGKAAITEKGVSDGTA